MSNKPLIVRLAESSSALGAGILGLGIGVWLSDGIRQFQWYLILAGVLLHTFGMVIMNMHDDKLEQLSPFWRRSFQFLFWICLAFLVFIFIRIIFYKS